MEKEGPERTQEREDKRAADPVYNEDKTRITSDKAQDEEKQNCIVSQVHTRRLRIVPRQLTRPNAHYSYYLNRTTPATRAASTNTMEHTTMTATLWKVSSK